MLYSIIFPILIVVSLAGIIMLLMKKATALALLKDKDENENIGNNFLGKIVNGEKVNNKSLLILEKITRKFKLMFLKLENIFSAWGESIKQKRRIKENEGKYSNIETRKIEEKEIEKKESFFQRRNEKRNVGNASVVVDMEKEIEFKEIPAVEKDEKIKASTKKKDLFEKILIDRIAANPKDVEAYERLGEYYFEIENWNYSKECFKQVVKLSPQNRNVRMKMRKLERILGE